ncbi:hypothetical protein ACPB9J_06010 [Streptomyces lavendulocolor]|uniref:hypothetical protein n=1 Tax=Streptomyces lavendulocolor TaxID=67316 RepID=UPI003C2B251B
MEAWHDRAAAAELTIDQINPDGTTLLRRGKTTHAAYELTGTGQPGATVDVKLMIGNVPLPATKGPATVDAEGRWKILFDSQASEMFATLRVTQSTGGEVNVQAYLQ